MGGKRNKAEKRAQRAQKVATTAPKKQRKKTPWKMRQLKRIERALKPLSKLSAVLTAAKAPGVDASLINVAFGNVGSVGTQLALIKDDWKPAKGHNPGTKKKAGVGDHIRVKPDLDLEGIKHFKHIPRELYEDAVISDDDTRSWIVQCADGIKRIIPKKYVQKILNATPSTPVIPTHAAVTATPPAKAA